MTPQNLLLTAKKGTTASLNTFTYDGLNRQVSRVVGTGGLFYRVYDKSWNVMGEYASGSGSAFFAYLYGTGGVVKNLKTSNYYYQDALGSTSHVANSSGQLKEYYRYDLQGAPLFFNASGQSLSDTAIGVRHLFTGQQWYNEIGLYDLRNRYYSPDIGRFLQSDPIGFEGDSTNLYRYCRNSPINLSDPIGLWTFQIGVSFNGHIGAFGINLQGGLVFDGQGGFGLYGSYAGLVGAGLNAGIGPTIAMSTGDDIMDVAGPFVVGSGSAGDGGGGTVDLFGGFGSKQQPVVGGGVTPSLDAGVSISGGISKTGIFRIFGAPVSPGQTSNLGGNDLGTFSGYSGQILDALPGETTIGGPIEIDPNTGQAVYSPNGYFPDQTFNPDGSPVGGGGGGEGVGFFGGGGFGGGFDARGFPSGAGFDLAGFGSGGSGLGGFGVSGDGGGGGPAYIPGGGYPIVRIY